MQQRTNVTLSVKKVENVQSMVLNTEVFLWASVFFCFLNVYVFKYTILFLTIICILICFKLYSTPREISVNDVKESFKWNIFNIVTFHPYVLYIVVFIVMNTYTLFFYNIYCETLNVEVTDRVMKTIYNPKQMIILIDQKENGIQKSYQLAVNERDWEKQRQRLLPFYAMVLDLSVEHFKFLPRIPDNEDWVGVYRDLQKMKSSGKTVVDETKLIKYYK